jgi:hypothetical protein
MLRMHKVQYFKTFHAIYTILPVGLSIYNWIMHRVGDISVIEITGVHIDTVRQKLDILSVSLSQILWMLDSIFHNAS